jgi:hypothetical protein
MYRLARADESKKTFNVTSAFPAKSPYSAMRPDGSASSRAASMRGFILGFSRNDFRHCFAVANDPNHFAFFDERKNL